jgi:Raf kinase inhibitor-like YbhB/YbcL family protein
VRTLACATVTAALLVAAGCSGDEAATTEEVDIPALPAGAFDLAGGDVVMGEPIDPLHTCDGTNISPALSWTGVPEGTVELALIVDDPDAPGGTFTHWVAYAISPEVTGLERGLPPGPALSGAVGLRQGLNDGSEVPGYTGPCPPGDETHGYVFTLFALDEATGLDGGASVDELRAAMEGHVLAEAVLTAPYARSSR